MDDSGEQNNLNFSACIVCQSRSLKKLEGYENNYLTRCGSCGLVFCNRIPTATELQHHYGRYPRNTQISVITLSRYNKLLDKFEVYRQTGNLLDVGCGDGYFLVEAKKRNWNVFGIEFAREAVNNCEQKGIQMAQGPLDIHSFETAYFDVITSFEVIEHINDPLRELAAFRSLLRPAGLVYVTTPNFNSISRAIAGSRWNIIEYPEHLTYYTQQTLKNLFSTNGFRTLEIFTNGISLSRLKKSTLLGKNGVKADESLRQKIEKNRLLSVMKSLANYMLSILGKGDAMKAFFIKE